MVGIYRASVQRRMMKGDSCGQRTQTRNASYLYSNSQHVL